MLLIFSGPSGVGKSRLIDVATERFGFGRVVPVTSRAPRNGERDGYDYEFITKREFRSLVKSNVLCSWDYTLRNYYGYRKSIERRLHRGEHIVLHSLSRMALRMSNELPDCFLVFLDSGAEVILDERLARRDCDEVDLVLRKQHWDEEKEHSALFDIIIRDAEQTSTNKITDVIAELVQRFA